MAQSRALVLDGVLRIAAVTLRRLSAVLGAGRIVVGHIVGETVAQLVDGLQTGERLTADGTLSTSLVASFGAGGVYGIHISGVIHTVMLGVGILGSDGVGFGTATLAGAGVDTLDRTSPRTPLVAQSRALGYAAAFTLAGPGFGAGSVFPVMAFGLCQHLTTGGTCLIFGASSFAAGLVTHTFNYIREGAAADRTGSGLRHVLTGVGCGRRPLASSTRLSTQDGFAICAIHVMSTVRITLCGCWIIVIACFIWLITTAWITAICMPSAIKNC